MYLLYVNSKKKKYENYSVHSEAEILNSLEHFQYYIFAYSCLEICTYLKVEKKNFKYNFFYVSVFKFQILMITQEWKDIGSLF